MAKTKIYIFHPYSKIGGADLSISRLINNLDEKKYEITFLCINKPEIKFYLNKKIEIISFKKKRAFQCLLKLRDYIKKNSLRDKKFKKIIFISNQNFANIISMFSLFQIKNIKKILIERNNPIELSYNLNIKNLIIKILMAISYKFSDAIVGISQDLSKDLSKICQRKVITIYNPSFDKRLYNFANRKKITKPFKKIILNIARFEKQKNHFMLIDSFKLSLKKFDSHLILIGYGKYENLIKQYIKINKLEKKITIISNPKNPYAYYKIADLFVLSSIYEGFGNVLIEAGMFKIPIISTDCKSGPSEILNKGKYGDLVKIGDNKKLSELIVKNLRSKKPNKINLMYNSLNRFEIKEHIQKYEKLFEKI